MIEFDEIFWELLAPIRILNTKHVKNEHLLPHSTAKLYLSLRDLLWECIVSLQQTGLILLHALQTSLLFS